MSRSPTLTLSSTNDLHEFWRKILNWNLIPSLLLQHWTLKGTQIRIPWFRCAPFSKYLSKCRWCLCYTMCEVFASSSRSFSLCNANDVWFYIFGILTWFVMTKHYLCLILPTDYFPFCFTPQGTDMTFSTWCHGKLCGSCSGKKTWVLGFLFLIPPVWFLLPNMIR